MMYRVISQYDGAVWFESKSYEDCVEYLHNCSDVAEEKELCIEEVERKQTN